MTIRPKIRSGVVLASLSTIVLAGVPLASATPAGSDNVPSLTSTVADNSEVDAATREKADRFISTQEDQFVIDGAAKSALTPNELQKVEASVKEANTAIASASSTNDPSVEKKVNDKSIAFSQSTGPRIENTDGDAVDPFFQPGRNGIEYYWWGVKVFISQGTLKGIGAGVSIAGVWIPEPLVSKIVSTLGIAVAVAPGGIWADFTYAQFALLPVNPASIAPVRAGFQ